VKRYRLLYSKGEEIAFLGHLDVTRALSRLLRRSGVSVAFSQGFSPRPLLSMGPALPVGAEGERELCDIFTEEVLSDTDFRQMQELATPGLILKTISEVKIDCPSLTALPFLSTWEMRGTFSRQPKEDLVRDILLEKHLFIKRQTPKASYEIDLRPYLIDIEVGCDWIKVDLLSTPNRGIRIDEILSLFSERGFPFRLSWLKRVELMIPAPPDILFPDDKTLKKE